MLHIHAASIEVLIGSGNLYTTLPTAAAEEVTSTWVVDSCTVDGQVIVVEARIHRTFGSTCPHTVLVLLQYGAAASTESKADDN